MARIRLNQEYRNKIANRLRVHLEQEDTQEKRLYDDLKADQININDNAWAVAEKIVRRHYTDEDVEKAYYLQNKFENVSTIAKDSCFHFHYQGLKEEKDYDGNVSMQPSTIQDGKENNPHKTKYVDNNDKYLSCNSDDKGYGKEWNDKYCLDLIGRDYCRDRSIACTEEEFQFLVNWKQEKGKFVIAHYKWIKSVLNQMKEIKIGLKGYKWLDEAIELANELGLDLQDHEIIRTNSTGLVIYNPKNLAERIKGMKNKEKTREQKIAERVAYMQQSEINSDNLN